LVNRGSHDYDHVPAALTRAGKSVLEVGAETHAIGTLRQQSRDKQTMPDPALHTHAAADSAIVASLGRRSIVLVGMMGAGKSSVGRKLAGRLALPFVDADTEIEAAAGMSIPDIFETRGEAEFRAGEARVIARLLEAGPQVLATGGGAFMNAETRAAIRARGVSVWLRADFDVLMKRIKRRGDRPMLKTDDPPATLRALIAQRYPVYAEADITIDSRDVLHEVIVDETLDALRSRFANAGVTEGRPV
jgi:shikimate kinase